MSRRQRNLTPLDDRGPLRVMFMVTSMPIGGAETLLVNLVRRLDRDRFLPEICCLKEPGPLGEELAREMAVHSRIIAGKFDVRVLPRLVKLLRRQRIDAVVTVGAGDKMFWGRLAAWYAGIPVVLSALHSTGWPDGIGFLNRRLTRITDAFIGVAGAHGQHLIEHERFPAAKVRVIPNGIDTDHFRELTASDSLRYELNLPFGAPVAGIVAALRPEKNHELLLQAMQLVVREIPDAHLLVVGDGPRRAVLTQLAKEYEISDRVRFVGARRDVAQLLALIDVFTLSSHNEANPVSILEAMACAKPVISTRVGSIDEVVQDANTGFLVDRGDARRIARHLIQLFRRPDLARRMGRLGREWVVRHGSLDQMTRGYEALIAEVYTAKCGQNRPNSGQGLCPVPAAGYDSSP